MRRLRLSWIPLQGLASAQLERLARNTSDSDSEAIKSSQKGVRDAFDKAVGAVQDIQQLEDLTKRYQYEVAKRDR